MPPNNEWNRLEQLYKMKQEEQRRIEMANFQRVLAQADALTKSMQASGIAPTPQPWTPYRNEFKKGGNTKSDEGYNEYMEKVAKNNAAKWEMSEEEALLHILNDPTYNYRAYYEANKANPNLDSDNHWPDTYKTAYHPTFSNESVYSGKQSQYNPNAEVGGSWVGNSDILYPSFMWNPEVAYYIEQGKGQVPQKQKNRFDGTEEREIERTSKKEDREIQYIDAGYDEEGNRQVRRFDKASGRQLIIDPETGELTDGKYLRGTEYATPEVIIKPQRYHSPYGYSSANDWDQLKVLMQAVTDAAKELTPQPVKDKVKDAMASPIVQKTIGSPTVQAALPYLNALSPAAWMDTAYDAMYTPNEINYPWDEGNEGLGSPVLDILFDAGAYGVWAKAIGAGAKGVSMANNYAKGAAQRYRWANRPNINAYNYFKKIKFADPEDLKGKDLDLKKYFQINAGYDEKTKQVTNNIWDFDLQKPDGTWVGGVYGKAEKGNPSIEFNLMSESPQINRRFGYKFTGDIPDWSVLASDTKAKTASYIPKKDKWRYIFTGKVPQNPDTSLDYSLDVAKMLKSMYEHPRPGFEVEISPYFKMNSTNPYSQNFANTFAKEFNFNPDAGKIPFNDLTPQQVDHFNFKYGDTYGIIDPETRTMPFYVVRKVPTKVSKKKKK